jgi:hypothetical protein
MVDTRHMGPYFAKQMARRAGIRGIQYRRNVDGKSYVGLTLIGQVLSVELLFEGIGVASGL